MHTFPGLAALVALLLALPGASAHAQDHRIVAGYGAGYLSPGALNPGAGEADLRQEAGWIATAFGETWQLAGGRLGTRLGVAYTQRPLQVEDEVRSIGTWLADASLVLRPLPVRDGRAVAPFLSAGGGIASYGLGPGTPRPLPESGVEYSGDAQRQWTLVGGAGLDVHFHRLSIGGTPLGLRLEVADHVVLHSPFESLDGQRLGPIHNLRFGASLIGLGWF